MAVKATAEITLRDQTDAEAIILWHYVSTSATKPNKPNTTSASATPSGWSKSEPSVSSDSDLSKYDYTSLQTVWGDGTCDWGDVNLSASYEAAKRAWNKAGGVENQLNNLEIGGRNLARNTADFSGWGRDNTVWTFSDGVATFIPPSTRSWKQLGQQPGAPLSLFDFDATYVISFDAMLVSGTVASGDSLSPCVALRDTADTNSRKRYRSWNVISSLTSEWKRITKVIDPLPISSWSGTASSEAYFGVDFWLYTATATIAIRNVKLEKGNKATDWTPAPEDVTNDINTVSTAMSEANEGLADSIAGVSKSLEEANTRITNLTKAVEDADADRAKWVHVDSENGLTIGATGSSYNLVLDNNSVNFMVGDQLAATASVDAFIPTALRLGDYVFSGSGGYLYIDYQPLQTQ